MARFLLGMFLILSFFNFYGCGGGGGGGGGSSGSVSGGSSGSVEPIPAEPVEKKIVINILSEEDIAGTAELLLEDGQLLIAELVVNNNKVEIILDRETLELLNRVNVERLLLRLKDDPSKQYVIDLDVFKERPQEIYVSAFHSLLAQGSIRESYYLQGLNLMDINQDGIISIEDTYSYENAYSLSVLDNSKPDITVAYYVVDDSPLEVAVVGNTITFQLAFPDSSENIVKKLVKLIVLKDSGGHLRKEEVLNKEFSENEKELNITVPSGSGLILYTYCEVTKTEDDNKTEEEYCYPTRILNFKNISRRGSEEHENPRVYKLSYFLSAEEKALFKVNELYYFFEFSDGKESFNRVLDFWERPTNLKLSKELVKDALRAPFFKEVQINTSPLH